MSTTVSEHELRRLRHWYEQVIALAAELRDRGVAIPTHEQADLEQLGQQLAALEAAAANSPD